MDQYACRQVDGILSGENRILLPGREVCGYTGGSREKQHPEQSDRLRAAVVSIRNVGECFLSGIRNGVRGERRFDSDGLPKKEHPLHRGRRTAVQVRTGKNALRSAPDWLSDGTD